MIALNKLRICLVEDDPLIRDAAEMGLTDRGYEVVVAGDGAKGLEAVREHAPDLVITDIVMPDSDGFEFLPRLRAAFPHLPVIAVSGGGQTGTGLYLDMARQMGASACLTKPFSLDQLAEEIERVWKRVRDAKSATQV